MKQLVIFKKLKLAVRGLICCVYKLGQLVAGHHTHTHTQIQTKVALTVLLN